MTVTYAIFSILCAWLTGFGAGMIYRTFRRVVEGWGT